MDSVIQIKSGSVGQSIIFVEGNGSYVAGNSIRCYYSRVRETPSYITCVALSAPNAAWLSGAFGMIQDPPGGTQGFRFDVPNAWLAAGSRQLTLSFYNNTNGSMLGNFQIEITETDNQLGVIVPTAVKTEFPSSTSTKVTTTAKDAAGNVVTTATVVMVSSIGVSKVATHEGSGVYAATFDNDTELGTGAMTVHLTFAGWLRWVKAFVLEHPKQLVAKCVIGTGLILPVSFPLQVIAQVTDLMGRPITGAVVIATIEGSAVTLTERGDGMYSSSYTYGSAGQKTASVPFVITKSGYPTLTAYAPVSILIT